MKGRGSQPEVARPSHGKQEGSCSEGAASQQERQDVHVLLPHTKMTKQPLSSRQLVVCLHCLVVGI